jgi:hypothetical protein
MAEQIIFSDYQAAVFNQTTNLLKTQGYLGEQLFEDTYVLQKRTADWIISNVPVMGLVGSVMAEATNTYIGSVMAEATNAYNGVLGITPNTSPAPAVTTQLEPDRPSSEVSVPISFGTTTVRTTNPIKTTITTPVAIPLSKPVSVPQPTSLTRL